ncbi:MAG: putative lipid II flippase FtsW [Deltaproteobacteria bacterium]|nr:putative lipid II flippase FtsW [Deltaproteobacteria bacterium]
MKKTRFHYGLLLTTIYLVLVGIVLVYSTSAIYAQERFGDSFYFFKRHLIYAFVSIVLMCAIIWLPKDLFKKGAYPLFFLSLILLFLVFVPGIGQKVGIAARWIKVGAVRFQPSELMKLALIFYLAYIITEKNWVERVFHKLLPHFFLVSLILLNLYLQPDFGNVVIYLGLIFLLIFIGGIRFPYILVSFLVSTPFIYYLAFSEGYRRKRILSFLNPWNDPQNSGYQIIQSYLAFFSGGLLGRGLGEGRTKLFYLPEAHTDFIFSSLGEELGFIGSFAVLAGFIYIIYQGTRISLRAPTPFLFCLGAGITGMIGIEAFMNMAVVTGLLPTKGLPLPFVSFGGTSLFINLIGIGILLNISKYVEETQL